MWNCDVEKLDRVVGKMREFLDGRIPTVAITLGSGFGPFRGPQLGNRSIKYEDLGLEPCQVDGHAGVLEYFELGKQNALVFCGRVHPYEFDAQTAVLGLRAAIKAGVMVHILTCASGAINKEIKPGDIVMIKDHLNLSGHNPLLGKDFLGAKSRFPDMSNAYDRDLRDAVVKPAYEACGIPCRWGKIATVLGPSYETPAEIRMLWKLGADLVGMSMAIETIAARHMRAKVIGLSCATNRAAGQDGPLSHPEVNSMMQKVAPKFWDLLIATVERLPVPA